MVGQLDVLERRLGFGFSPGLFGPRGDNAAQLVWPSGGAVGIVQRRNVPLSGTHRDDGRAIGPHDRCTGSHAQNVIAVLCRYQVSAGCSGLFRERGLVYGFDALPVATL